MESGNGIVSKPFGLISTPTSRLSEGVQPDMFHRVASDMATVHNMMVRGLNSIYLQAPHVQPEDYQSFLNYSYCFYDLLHNHHGGEEANIFPAIELMSGEEGIMAKNVEQHHAFEAGLNSYKDYIDKCRSGEESYDGSKFVDIIDSFASGMVGHLHDEIATLLGLAKYADRPEMAGLEDMFNRESANHMKKLAVTGTFTWGIFNHDTEYEDGLWTNWPPAPWILKFGVRRVTSRVHQDWWKFAPVDSAGLLKPKLYATPPASQ